MCDLLVDHQVEAGTQALSSDSPVTLTCSEGRVIIAATAWVGNTTTGKPVGVSLADGDLSNECVVYPTSNAVGGVSPQTLHYSLTTARQATL